MEEPASGQLPGHSPLLAGFGFDPARAVTGLIYDEACLFSRKGRENPAAAHPVRAQFVEVVRDLRQLIPGRLGGWRAQFLAICPTSFILCACPVLSRSQRRLASFPCWRRYVCGVVSIAYKKHGAAGGGS